MDLPRRVDKPWGYEIWYANDEVKDYCGKVLVITVGWSLSLHRHHIKDEVFYIQEGLVRVEISRNGNVHDLDSMICKPGDRCHIPTGTWHRITALQPSAVLEASTFHRDDDVERHEPAYCGG